MRIAFSSELLAKAKKNRNIMLLTGDLGFSVFEPWIEQLSDQYINMGIAEQNMAGVAAGLAMEGKIPFIYSIIPFTTMRNYEQIRNDICYQNLNVKIIGVGAGFSYGPYGHTHHALEDIGVMRGLANLTIFSPGDPTEARFAVREAMKIKGPVYIRLGKAGDPIVHKSIEDLVFGKGAVIKKGKDATIIATSTMVYRALEVTELLKEQGIKAGLISMHTIKPFDDDLIIATAKKTNALITLEEHSIINGLGSAVSEVLAENNIHIKFKRIGVPDRITKVMGLQEYMRKANWLTKEQITETIRNLIEK